jgi:hypothetical protein
VHSPGDDRPEMPPSWLPDDETIDAIVAGDPVDARFERIAGFARQVRQLGDGPPPPPSPALEAAFAGRPERRRRQGVSLPRGRLTTTAAKVAGLGVVAKIGLGTSVAAAGVVAAGAGGVLPDPATREVRAGIEAVTPLDFGPPGPTRSPAEPDRSGPTPTPVSGDASDESPDAPTTETDRTNRGRRGSDTSEATHPHGNDRSPNANHQPPGHDDGSDSSGGPSNQNDDPGNSGSHQPGNSGQSGNSGNSGNSGQSGNPENPGRSGSPSSPGRSSNSSHGQHAGQSDN